MSKELDYIAELERENRLLGERCNQFLKDKGYLTDKLQELKEILAQTIENDEVAYETLKLHDQEEIGMLNSKVTELENKIADIKANCDLAIEGRDIKIKELELELTVEKDQHQEEINLHLHAEDYIKELERLISNQAESLRVTMLEEEKKGKRIDELEKENAELKEQGDKWFVFETEAGNWGMDKATQYTVDRHNYFYGTKEECQKWGVEHKIKDYTGHKYCYDRLDNQLAKAKDLIEDMYDKIPASHSDYYKDVMERARQFLKEIEK